MHLTKGLCRAFERFATGTFRNFRRFGTDSAGGVAAVVAIVSPVLVGSMGLGAEAGYWYLTQRKVQNAADVAAHAAVIRLKEGDSEIQLQTLAEYVVGESDLDLTLTSVNLANPPQFGSYIEDFDAVEVTVTRTVPRLFSAIYGQGDVQISARAVATTTPSGTGCVLALSQTQAGAITIGGFSQTLLLNCELISNGPGNSIETNGATNGLVAACARAAGSANLNPAAILTCGGAMENQPPVADPFATLPEPVATGACRDKNVENEILTPTEPHASGMTSMRFCNGLDVKGFTTFSPGLYIIEGGEFKINSNAFVSGAGVTFYLADGVDIQFNGTASMTFSAPTSGTYEGMLFFSSRSSTSVSHSLNGTAATSFDGAIYAASSHLSFNGGGMTSGLGCTQVVADTIDFSGSAMMNLHCLFPPSSSPIISIAGDTSIVE